MGSGKSCTRTRMANNEALRLPNWEAALAKVSSGREYVVYKEVILGFLHHCKISRAPATVMLAKQYIEQIEKQCNKRDEMAREALRWFVKMARARTLEEAADATAPWAPGVSKADHAPMAASDLGGADWERALIRAVREKGFLWRTERTYREWAARFAQFLRPRSPYAATKDDVGAFLSMLAVELRSSQASQKQALNALVFLMQEALHRELGELKFRRSQKPQRMPTVLSREECARLFDQLSGTKRLMAELAYGAGLRLMELLRLRVHHLDLERGQSLGP